MKKSLLFVEDEPLQLQMYAMMLDDEQDHWDVSFAPNAKRALQLMDQATFDVVVSDLMMPNMDGIEFMTEVRRRNPGCARIIISILSDQEKVAHSLNSTHQFIAKPFDVRALKATLARICGLDAYLSDGKLKTLAGQLRTLPSFPTLYLEVTKELGSLDSSIESVAALIVKDPGMTAKMLQIVNSAAIGLARKISSPYEAVQFLGLGTVRSLVLTAHIFSRFRPTQVKGFSLDRLWRHGLGCAQIACLILQQERAEPAEVEDAFMAAMLHDVGKLMLADSLPEQFEQALALAAERKIHHYEAEMEIFGATHAGAASYLLGLWGLPAPIVEAVAFHHSPGRSDLHAFSALTAVHVADALEHELSRAEPSRRPAEIDMNYLAGLKLDKRMDAWHAEAAKWMQLHQGS